MHDHRRKSGQCRQLVSARADALTRPTLQFAALQMPEIAIIYVRLLDEAVDAWRPVQAVDLGAGRYRIAEQPHEASACFGPGSRVTDWAPGRGRLRAVSAGQKLRRPC